MSTNSQLPASQAFNQSFPINEHVNKSTGSLVLSKGLANLAGITKGIGLNVSLGYMAGTNGILGLPDGWNFGLPYVTNGASFTTQGKTFVIDPDWTDSLGNKSGLRYVNGHGKRFETIMPTQSLPSGSGRTYEFKFTYEDGSVDYFDATGKLLAHDDLFGNRINYEYQNQSQGVIGNYLKQITDSFGQNVSFGYYPNPIVVTLPDGKKTTITYSSQGVQYIDDQESNRTIFTYVTVASTQVMARIDYPTGLSTIIDYVSLKYLDSSGAQRELPAVSALTHLDQADTILDKTVYAYGTETGNTYTGYSVGYQMGSRNDGLMDSNNTDYIYDVLVEKQDAAGNRIALSRVYYNYLHLPVQVEHYLIDTAHAPSPDYRTLYTYDIDLDLHARTTNYNKPVTTKQFVYSSVKSDYVPLRQSTASYDDFGQLLTHVESMYDPASEKFVDQTSLTHSYKGATWGGKMPSETIYTDVVSGTQRRIEYTLTLDEKHIATATVSFKNHASDPNWSPWKHKTYGYDSQGRLTSWQLSWSSGTTSIGVQSTGATTQYSYDASNHKLTVAKTDALNRVRTSVRDVRLPRAPIVEKKNPAGDVVTWAYDTLARVTQETEPDGTVSTYTYKVAAKDGHNSVVSISATGYVVETYYDALGRKIKVMDNGDPTASGTSVTRTLRQAAYTALGKTAKKINALGLTTTFEYDSRGREIKSIDPVGNVRTTDFDDAALTSTEKLNGALRQIVQKDGLGRVTTTTSYPDSDDSSLAFCRVRQITYDGFGHKLVVAQGSAPLSNSAGVTVENQTSFVYDVESKVTQQTNVGHLADKVEVVRDKTRDLFGNAVATTKITTYADGRKYTVQGPTLAYDKTSQLTTVTTPLNQVESYTYDANSRLASRTRFDGTTFRYAYDQNGRLETMSWGSKQIAYTYLPDDLTATVTSDAGTMRYDYYLDGSAKSIQYPDGQTLSFQLDATDRVVSQTDPSGTVTATTFDQFGRLQTRSNGSDTVRFSYGTVNHATGTLTETKLSGLATITTQYAYDGFGGISSITANDGSGRLLLERRYGRDTLRRLTSLTLSSKAAQADEVNSTSAFAYDGLNQLVSRVTTYPSGSAQESLTYTLDGNGNVLSRDRDGSVEHYAYNAADQLQQTGMSYDTNGRMTTDASGNRYAYNALDQLSAVTLASGQTVQYAYNPDGFMAARTLAAARLDYYYNAGVVNAVKSSAGSETWTSFLLSAGSRIGAYAPGQAPTYYIVANRSTTLVQTGSSQFNAIGYDPYGNRTAGTLLSEATSFTWNQEYTDAAANLVHLRSRFYNPALMRFMTMDSKRTENRYAYCNGDPVNAFDPTGHASAADRKAAETALTVIGIAAMIATAIAGVAVSVVTLGAAAPEAFAAETVEATMFAADLATAAAVDVATDAAAIEIGGGLGEALTAPLAMAQAASEAIESITSVDVAEVTATEVSLITRGVGETASAVPATTIDETLTQAVEETQVSGLGRSTSLLEAREPAPVGTRGPVAQPKLPVERTPETPHPGPGDEMPSWQIGSRPQYRDPKVAIRMREFIGESRAMDMRRLEARRVYEEVEAKIRWEKFCRYVMGDETEETIYG